MVEKEESELCPYGPADSLASPTDFGEPTPSNRPSKPEQRAQGKRQGESSLADTFLTNTAIIYRSTHSQQYGQVRHADGVHAPAQLRYE